MNRATPPTLTCIFPKGVFGFPGCPGEDLFLCELMRRLLNLGAYLEPIQNILIQAQVGSGCFVVDVVKLLFFDDSTGTTL